MSPRYAVCCEHPVDVHEHYRPGTDCSLCPCPRLRRVRLPGRPGGLLWTLRFFAGLARQLR